MSDLLLNASDVQMRACCCLFLVLTKGVREGRFQGRCWSCSSYSPTSRSSITCWSLSSGPDQPAVFHLSGCPSLQTVTPKFCYKNRERVSEAPPKSRRSTAFLWSKDPVILAVDERQCLKITVHRYTTLFVHTVHIYMYKCMLNILIANI